MTAAKDAENSNKNNYDMSFECSNGDIAQDFGKHVNLWDVSLELTGPS